MRSSQNCISVSFCWNVSVCFQCIVFLCSTQCHWMGEGVQREDTPLYRQIWKATFTLKGTAGCSCLRLFALKRRILNSRNIKSHYSISLPAFLWKAADESPESHVNLQLSVCLALFLLLPPPLSTSLRSPALTPIPTSLYLELCGWRRVLFFKPPLC